MKILVLTSGGDAPGMNMILATLYKHFGNNIYACKAGFKGLIDNDILPLSDFLPLEHAKEAGSCIKCSRCLEFITDKGFNKGLTNAKKYDVLVVLGGNGSYKGCSRLNENGMRTIFIPATIDNDVTISDYSMGYHTAIDACVKTIKNIMPTMEAFNRCAIFETMGRESSRIAKCTSAGYPCDYVILNKNDINYKKMAQIIREKYIQGHASCILIKEKIVKTQTIIKNLKSILPEIEFKSIIIGYVQRGSSPTIIELEYAKTFAKLAINTITKTNYSGAIVYKKDSFDVIYKNK